MYLCTESIEECYNRTNVELKCLPIRGESPQSWCYNRTNVELKSLTTCIKSKIRML